MSEKHDLEYLQSEEKVLKDEIMELRGKHKKPVTLIVLTAVCGGIAGILFSIASISYLETYQFDHTISTVFFIIFGIFAVAAFAFLASLLVRINHNKPINEKLNEKKKELKEIQGKLAITLRSAATSEQKESQVEQKESQVEQKEHKVEQKPNLVKADEYPVSNTGDKLIFGGLDGAQRILDVYEDRVVLTQKKNFRAFLTHDLFKGAKEIYYTDMSSIQFKKASSLILGYIQFEVAGLAGNNFGSENSWTYETYRQKEADKAVAYIKARLSEMKKQKAGGGNTQVINQLSAADEIRKYKELFDEGIITEEEYNAKKKELLGL